MSDCICSPSQPCNDCLFLTAETTLACEDCLEKPVARFFVHMTYGHFLLCEDCFENADHEDDYLQYCTCRHPRGSISKGCRRCYRTIRGCECNGHRAPEIQLQWEDIVEDELCRWCWCLVDKRTLAKIRLDVFREELMQKAWHPSRVARWLAAGEEVLDSFLTPPPSNPV